MVRAIKYLLFLLVILISVLSIQPMECTEEQEIASSYSYVDKISMQDINGYSEDGLFSTTISITSTANAFRALKRFEYLKHAIIFLKSDKVINTEVTCSLQEISINLYSTLSEPTYRLIKLRRFII